MASGTGRGELPGPVDDLAGTLGATDPTRAPVIAPVLARTIVATVFLGICSFAALQVALSGASVWMITQATTYLLVLLALQVFYFSKPGTALRSPPTYAVLAVQACLVFVPQAQFGAAWAGMPTLLAGTVLLVFPHVLGWIAVALIIGVIARSQFMLTGSALDVAYIVMGGIGVTLEVYGLTRLAGLVTDLHDARSELGRVAVARERTRFASDLHDLLGLSLATIGPKGAIARRVLASEPERARKELGEILTVSRHALADVRLIAGGYREMSLDEESRTVESLLAASNVEVRMELDHGEIPAHLRSVVVAVLRAGVANVLDHTAVRRCEISLRQAAKTVTLDIIDDGESVRCPSELGDSESFEVLLKRVAALDGTLAVGIDPDGRYGLHLTIPVSRESADSAAVRDGDGESRFTTLLSTGVMNAVFVGFIVTAILHLMYLTHEVPVLAVSAACLTALVALQVLYVSKPGGRLVAPTKYAVIAVQAVLVYVPLALYPHAWVSLPGMLAGTMLLVLRPVAGWAGFFAVVVSVPVAQSGFHGAFADVFYNVGTTVITGFVTFGLTWMARAVSELRAVRRELAQAAVADERMRFARDLHDLLGLSLSAITLKTELTLRLMDADPARARTELMEIVAISRLALADVRLVASGYRDLSLNEESRSAESVLAAADVDVRMDLHYGELPVEVRTVLATVLREGVTNVLRHSKGAHCEITVRRQDDMVLLEIVNDGVAEPVRSSVGGSGIRNLSARVATVGGHLTAGVEPDGSFRLRAFVPA